MLQISPSAMIKWTQCWLHTQAALAVDLAGGFFNWRDNMLLTKSTSATSPGWQLAGMLQFDHLGHLAFIHRTINKFWITQEPWPMDLMTGPLPYR